MHWPSRAAPGGRPPPATPFPTEDGRGGSPSAGPALEGSGLCARDLWEAASFAAPDGVTEVLQPFHFKKIKTTFFEEKKEVYASFLSGMLWDAV
jgi:hypothetical protein